MSTISVLGRVLIALLCSQGLAGISAGLAVFIANTVDPTISLQPLPTALGFATFGIIVLFWPVLLTELSLTIFQASLERPSLTIQLVGSGIVGTVLSCVVFFTGKKVDAGAISFAVVTGLLGGVLIGLAWFYLVVDPTHQSNKLSLDGRT